MTDLQISARLKENEQKWLVKTIEKIYRKTLKQGISEKHIFYMEKKLI